MLLITNNVFYHILPSKISHYGMRLHFHWGAGIITTYLFMVHMTRTFYTGSYKPPRELNWCVGVILLMLTFLLSFSGYLLP